MNIVSQCEPLSEQPTIREECLLESNDLSQKNCLLDRCYAFCLDVYNSAIEDGHQPCQMIRSNLLHCQSECNVVNEKMSINGYDSLNKETILLENTTMDDVKTFTGKNISDVVSTTMSTETTNPSTTITNNIITSITTEGTFSSKTEMLETTMSSFTNPIDGFEFTSKEDEAYIPTKVIQRVLIWFGCAIIILLFLTTLFYHLKRSNSSVKRNLVHTSPRKSEKKSEAEHNVEEGTSD